MNRRQCLASAGAIASAALAGCLDSVGTVDLDAPSETVEQEETHLLFERGGTELLALSIVHRGGFDPASGLMQLRLNAWHRDETHLDEFRYEIETPAGDSGPPTEVFLETPPGDQWPKLGFHQITGNKASIVEAASLGPIGRGSITIDFLLRPLANPDDIPDPFSVVIDALFTVSGSGVVPRTYRASARTKVRIGHDSG